MAEPTRRSPLLGPDVRVIYSAKLYALATVLTVGLLLKWLVFPAAPLALMTVVVVLSGLPMLAVVAWPGQVPAMLLALSLVTDIIGISACTHFGGGVEMVSGPMVYLVVVVLAGMLFSERAAFATAGGSALAYGLVLWAEHQGLLAQYAPYTRAPGRQLSAVFNVTVGLFVAAWVVLYAIRQVRAVYRGAEALRGEAVRTLSHDLQSPLDVIQRDTQRLAAVTPAERQACLRQIQDVAQRALGLVRTVLDAAREAQSGKLLHGERLPGPNVRAIYVVKSAAYATLIIAGWLLKWLHAPEVPAATGTLIIGLALLPNFAVAVRRGTVPRWLLGISIAADVAGVTVGIHVGGGVEMISGPIAYIVVIGLAGLVLSERAAVLAATASVLGYGLVAWMEYRGLVPHRFLSWRTPERQAVAVAMVSTCLWLATWVVLYAVRQVRAIYLRADAVRREVVSALSHDLKNPLGNIQGYAELAEDCAPDALPEYVHGMQRATQQALDLVRNVLDASAIEGRPLAPQRQPVDLNALVAQVIETYRFAANGKDIQLHVALDAPVRAVNVDAQMLARAIGNLMSNAIKYTPSGRAVQVITGANADMVTIAIHDSGDGIPLDEQSRLFQKYSRTSSGRGIEGTGLGLYIVRRIAEAHGGCVRLASHLGKGSRFILELPLQTAP